MSDLTGAEGGDKAACTQSEHKSVTNAEMCTIGNLRSKINFASS